MFGSYLFKIVNGKWEHEGYRNIYIPGLSSTTVVPKGTWIQELVSGVSGSEVSGVLGSGQAIGMLTQDVTLNGISDDAGFKSMTIGKLDLPVAVGTAVSLRKPTLGAELEFEGGGEAGPGNLVCTSGTGALSAATAYGTILSVYQGSLRVAQSGDDNLFKMLDAAVAVKVSTSVMRCRVKYIGGASKT